MTEKIGLIKNPLTVIAIFAGIAEVSGTVVLPFISENNQLTFIYFLIIFPSILVTLFFLTLNFNNKALYAPSDFNNEENYIKIFKYDVSKQENIEVLISQDEMLKILNNNILEFKISQTEKLKKLENEFKELNSKLPQSKVILREVEQMEENYIDDEYDYDDDDEYDDGFSTAKDLISIANFIDAKNFERKLTSKGFLAEIYKLENSHIIRLNRHKSIWLGYKVPFKLAKETLLIAHENYPHLAYIDLSNNNSKPPEYVHYQIFIGGSTSTAIERGIKAFKKNDWEELKATKNLKELHELIKRFQ